MKEHTRHGYMEVEAVSVITMCLGYRMLVMTAVCLFSFLKKECDYRLGKKMNRTRMNLYINGNLMDSQSAAMYRTQIERKVRRHHHHQQYSRV